MQEVTTGMREKENGSTGKNGERNKTLGTERCENIDTLFIYIKSSGPAVSSKVLEVVYHEIVVKNSGS